MIINMPNYSAQTSSCRAYLIKYFFYPLTTVARFTTWEQVRKLKLGYTVEEALDRANQPAEAYHCQEYLIKCFVSPIIARLFSTWEQVKKFNKGYTIDESLYMQTGETFSVDDTIVTMFGQVADENEFL